jgi:hypothetical protein
MQAGVVPAVDTVVIDHDKESAGFEHRVDR